MPAISITVAIRQQAIFPHTKGLLTQQPIQINSINASIAIRTAYLTIFGIFLLIKKSAIYGSIDTSPQTSNSSLI